MKAINMIVLPLLFTQTGLASQSPFISDESSVSACLRVPFDCGHANEQAEALLIRKCQEVAKSLMSFSIDRCEPDGDDGGYVNYFSVTASGECL